MPKLHLDIALADYDRTRPIIDGRVPVEGVELNCITAYWEEMFWRMLQYEEFDACELSMGSYLVDLGLGRDRFVALPVFLSRAFRHSCIFINTEAGIKEPQDLRGKRIGCPEYAMTAVVWARGMVHHEYGVAPHEVLWLTGGQEQPHRRERVELRLPPEIRVALIPPGATLNEMLEAGEIDAFFTARAPEPFLRGSPQVARLFPDYRSAEEEYYRRTRIFPIMHTFVIKRAIVEQNPWVAQSFYKAFCRAREQTTQELYQPAALKVMLPWLIAELEAERTVFGPDLWPYGVEANRPTLEALTQYVYEQGLTPQKFAVASLFAPTTLEEYRI